MQQATILTPQNTLNLPLTGFKLIEASAGTGKTYTISNLYCKAIVEGYLVNQILLVTFTNAATDELKTRIRQRLKVVLTLFKQIEIKPCEDIFLNELLLSHLKQDLDAQCLAVNRLNLALHSFDEAAIYTINGFSQRMLKDYAMSSGQGLDQELVSDDRHLWRAATQDWWRKTTYHLSQFELKLFNRSITSFEFLCSHNIKLRHVKFSNILPENSWSLNEVLQKSQQLLQDLYQIKPLFNQELSVLQQYFKEAQELNWFKAKPYNSDQWRIEFQQLEEYFSDDVLQSIPQNLKYLSKNFLQKSVYAKHKEQLKALDSELYSLIDDYLELFHTLSNHLLQRSLMESAQYADEQVQVIKEQQQLLTFDDQLIQLGYAIKHSPILVKQLRTHFPLAFIDEFQDTNRVQYDVFKHIYHHQSNLGLMMIGDPKQAIYSFRGGDIFTYLLAKSDAADQLYSLNQNWRSTPQLIDALNHFFTFKNNAFIYDAMPYSPVIAGDQKAMPLLLDGVETTAMSVCFLPEDTKGINQICADFTANEIANLLNLASKGKAHLQQPVKPADIAILVRKASEGAMIAHSLKLRGVNSINISKDSILQSDTAKSVLLLLKALAEPSNVQACRNMLASGLYQFEPNELEHLLLDENSWLAFCDAIKQLNAIWLKEGFMPMVYQALQTLHLSEHLSRQTFAERQLTNVLHIAELIQKQTEIHGSPFTTMQWLSNQIHEQHLTNDQDEQELRLESDAELVKIVTVHKSKGLEYPIVFVPFLWNAKTASEKETFYSYHEAQANKIDFAFEQKKLAAIKQDKQRLAEDMRLLYVGLTRAKSKLYVVTGKVKNTQSVKSALNFLLTKEQSAEDLEHSFANIGRNLNLTSDVKNNFQTTDNISFVDINSFQKHLSFTPDGSTVPTLKTATFTGSIRQDWIISSFSRMTRDVHQMAHEGHSGKDQDEILSFKKGGDVGTFLHHILEDIDFSGPLKQQIKPLFDRYAERYHLNSQENLAIVEQWIPHVIQTPLNHHDLSLSLLQTQDCLNELEFDFSIQQVDVNALNLFLQQRTWQTVSLLTMTNFRGLMKGFIDLVFRYDNQYFIVDYKSNYLGSQLNDYSSDRLEQAIINRRYDLQYLLYTLALHRYLKARLPQYDYERDFGGNFYLFLRGMRKSKGSDYGVYFNKPSLQEINTLDHHLFNSMSESNA